MELYEFEHLFDEAPTEKRLEYFKAAIYEGFIDPDSEAYSMDEFDEILSDRKPWELAVMVRYGGRWGWKQDSFSPYDKYFIFNGSGNLDSLPEYVLDKYIDDFTKQIFEYVMAFGTLDGEPVTDAEEVK